MYGECGRQLHNGNSSAQARPHQPLLALQSHLSKPALHTQDQVAALPTVSQRVLAVAPVLGQSASLQQGLQANLPGEIWQFFRPVRHGTARGLLDKRCTLCSTGWWCVPCKTLAGRASLAGGASGGTGAATASEGRAYRVRTRPAGSSRSRLQQWGAACGVGRGSRCRGGDILCC